MSHPRDGDQGHDGFHPHLPLRHVPAGELDDETAQTSGMHRLGGVTRAAGAEQLWMGQTHVAPATVSGDHHHGEAETAIYVLRGNPEFVFLDEATGEEVRLRTSPGDYVFVPPWTPHREENNAPDAEAVVVLARSTAEAIVVNLPSLRAGTSGSGTPSTPGGPPG